MASNNENVIKNDNVIKKFDWPDKAVMILCDILKRYIMRNGRSSPIKWQDLKPVFEKDAGTKLQSYKSLKNKYDGMRKEYNLWKSLITGETGLGWNESTRQLDCSEEWWDKKIKENPNVRTFRKRQPSSELQEAWDQIFGDAVASGIDCVAPSIDPSTFTNIPHVIIDDENPLTGNDVATGDHVRTSDATFFSSQYQPDSSHLGKEDGTYYSSLMNLASDLLSPNNTGVPNQPEKSSKESLKPKPVNMKRKNRESAGSVLFKDFITEHTASQKRTLELLELDVSPVNRSPGFSISAVVSSINKMVDDGILTKGGELWCFAMTLFEDAVKRELFLTLPDDAATLAWLNYKINVNN